MSVVYDAAVVGAGIIGSWTAYSLQKNGAKTVLLEQYSLGHTRGSSHGLSRITRSAYSESHYVQMMAEANSMWKRLEEETSVELYVPTGILVFGERDCPNDLQAVVSSLDKCGLPYQRFSGAEANVRYPGLKLPPDYDCVLERDGGILLADRALKTLQKQFKHLGGTLLEHHKVLRVCPGDTVSLHTNQGRVQARRVVLTPGGWASQVLSQLGLTVPLQPERAEVLYWKVANPDCFSADNFPTFWFTPSVAPEDNLIYGFPTCEYPRLIKICVRCCGPHISSPEEAQEAANQVPYSIATVSDFVAKHFSGVCTVPSDFSTCLFTNTPDLSPVIDRHPLHHNIVIGVGFSGHGFKLAPVMGKLLQELAMDLPLSFNLKHFSLHRLNFKTVRSNL